MFEVNEAYDFIKSFLEIENAQQQMEINKKLLLDEIAFKIISRICFQNVTLLSVHPKERTKPSLDQMKANYVRGVGGICCDITIPTFYLLTAIGFDVRMLHVSATVKNRFPNNHVALLICDVERTGDQHFVDVACGIPTFQSISLDFEYESRVYRDSYLEYKFMKTDGKLLRMHRKGDMLAMMGNPSNNGQVVETNPELNFWIDDWRRFYHTSDVKTGGTKDVTDFHRCHEAVYTKPNATVFHKSHRVVTFTGGKAAMVVNDKTLIENDEGDLVSTVLEGGDEDIKSAIKEICPQIPQELLSRSLLHWRQMAETK